MSSSMSSPGHPQCKLHGLARTGENFCPYCGELLSKELIAKFDAKTNYEKVTLKPGVQVPKIASPK